MNGKLDQEERRLGEFKERHIGELPEQLEANLATLQRLNTEMRLNKESQMRVLDQLEREKLTRQLVQARASAPDSDGHVPGGDGESLVARLSRLYQELTELRSRFSEKYPDVIRVKAEIASLEQQLAAAESNDGSAANPDSQVSPSRTQDRKVRSEAERELQTLREEEKALRQSVATYQRRVDNTPRRDQE